MINKNMLGEFYFIIYSSLFCFPLTYEGLHHSHAVGGEGAGLVGADGRGVAHGLTRVQVAHKVVVLHHFLHMM